MIEQTVEKLKSLRLSSFAKALRAQLESAQYTALPFEERLSLLVEEECLARENRRLANNLREARLKQQCCIEDVDFDKPRNLKRAQFMELAQCHWIQKGQNLIITGLTGSGKSFLACALADMACKLKLKARYVKISDLARELIIAREDGSYPRYMTRLAKIHLLVIDEWLRDPLSQAQAREILDMLDDRFRKRSTILISQLAVADWHKHITDPTLADAILDRVVHDSHRLELAARESMRKLTAKLH
jgi:DNA replication protein DnaC